MKRESVNIFPTSLYASPGHEAALLFFKSEDTVEKSEGKFYFFFSPLTWGELPLTEPSRLPCFPASRWELAADQTQNFLFQSATALWNARGRRRSWGTKRPQWLNTAIGWDRYSASALGSRGRLAPSCCSINAHKHTRWWRWCLWWRRRRWNQEIKRCSHFDLPVFLFWCFFFSKRTTANVKKI